MTKRMQIGNLYWIRTKRKTLRLLQYIGRDESALGSEIICVFREEVASPDALDPGTVAKGDVDFYAHVFLDVAVKLGVFEYCGYLKKTPSLDIFFWKHDLEMPSAARKPKGWWVWTPDLEPRYHPTLDQTVRKAYYGNVIPPGSILYRINEGVYEEGFT